MASSGSFHFSQATISQNVLTYKFTINQLHVDFITMEWKRYYQMEQVKVGQVLQSGATFITKSANYYKVVHYRKKMRETRKGNRFWQLTPLFAPDLPGDRHFTLGILEKLKFLKEHLRKAAEATCTYFEVGSTF